MGGEVLRAKPQLHRARVYTRDQMLAGADDSPIGHAVINGFNQARSGDIFMVPEPYWIPRDDFKSGTYSKRPGCGVVSGKTMYGGTSHSTPYEYDTHVPVIFYGQGIQAGRYLEPIAVNDIAPTLAMLLGIEA